MNSNNIEFIVIGRTRFGENSTVLHTLSKEYGRRGFLVRPGKRSAAALFMPLNVLEADISENPRSTLWSARNIAAAYPLAGIRGNIHKNAMTMFMSEVLYRVVKDGADGDGLFEWCRNSILTLDALQSDFSNFHIRFLFELSAELGFRPTFEDMAPFAKEHLAVIGRFMRSSFGESMLIPMTGAERNGVADVLLRYIEFHTESSVNVRSLRVLRELYD